MKMANGIGDFNKENPFIYLISTSNDALEVELAETSRMMVILAISTLFAIITTLINWSISSIIISIIILWLFIFAIIQLQSAIKSRKTIEITEMIYGNEFTYKFVNTESLIDQVMELRVTYGKCLFSREAANIFHLLNCCIILVNILRIFIRIFS